MLLEGLHIPLTTPFHRDGSLNTHALAANVLRYSRTPAAGLIVLGPSGEPTLLSDDETRDALRAAAQAAAPEKVLIAGISRDSVHATLELTTFAAEQRYDAVLVGAPSVLSGSAERELVTFLRVVADRTPIPVVLLSSQHRALSTRLILELASHPNVVGLLTEDSPSAFEGLARSADFRREATVTHVFAAITARMQRTAAGSLIAPASLTTAIAEPAPAQLPLRTRTKTVGFQILATRAPMLLDALSAGATGIAPAFAAAAPQASYEVYAAWKDQDAALASEKQQRIIEAAHFIDALGPGGLKYAADLNGYAGGLPRLPYLPPTGEQRAHLHELMKPLHN